MNVPSRARLIHLSEHSKTNDHAVLRKNVLQYLLFVGTSFQRELRITKSNSFNTKGAFKLSDEGVVNLSVSQTTNKNERTTNEQIFHSAELHGAQPR